MRERVRIRRAVESFRKAATKMFASTTSREGTGSGSSPRGLSAFLDAPSKPLVHEMRNLVDVPRGEGATLRNRLHPLQVPKALREDPTHDFAPPDLWVGAHPPMEVLRNREGDIRHLE